MKGRNFLKIAILMLGMTMSTACSNDDNIGGEETPPTSNTNTTATTSIKSTTLTADAGWNEARTTWVHEDFSRRYGLILYEGNILVLSQQRKSGQWAFAKAGYSAGSGIVDVKEVGKIGDITLKSSINNGDPTNDYYYYNRIGMALPFYPNHGYATCFVTGDDETKFMRIFAKGYTLDKQGALATITLQYQLY